MTTLRLTVLDAAEHLGVSVNAVRMRVRRETIAFEKDEKGNVWVLVEDSSADDSKTSRETNQSTSGQIEDLREQVSYLREVIATRDEELRRKDTIIMQMAQRIPELEPPQPHEASEEQAQEPPEGSEPKEAATNPESATQRRPWWRRWLGG